nr:helix-turn-helix domain-containing protein [uncultured Caproiciproducens sp.]
MDYKALLQPYRFLIVAALGEREASVKELLEKLPDIPQAAMYRCIKILEKASLIRKVSERKIKGAIEATYGLNFSMEKMSLEDGSVEAYLTAAYAVFFSYVHHKLAEHTPVVAQDNLQLSKFSTTIINIKKEEINKFTEETEALLRKYMAGDGDCYQLTTFLVPDGGK